MAEYENKSVEELYDDIRKLGEAKAYAQEMLDAKLIRREVYPLLILKGFTVDSAASLAQGITVPISISSATYIEGDVIEPNPMEALFLMQHFGDFVEDLAYEYPK